MGEAKERAPAASPIPSQFTLGTVQLGLRYGVANKRGQPDSAACHGILRAAVRSGVASFDTAPSYGDAEVRLGDYFSEHPIPAPFVITKLPKLGDIGDGTAEGIFAAAQRSVETSCQRLRRSSVAVVLLHHAPDLVECRGMAVKALAHLKREKLTLHIGASTYTPEHALAVLAAEDLDAIQVPVNLFDSRLHRMGILKALSARGVMVFARSVFLQGLLFLDPRALPPRLAAARQPLEELRGLAREIGRPVAEIAVAFVRDLPGVTSLVMGVETIEQLDQSAKLLGTEPLRASETEELLRAFSAVSEDVFNPVRWTDWVKS